MEELYELQSEIEERGPIGPVGFSSFVAFKRDFEKEGWWSAEQGGLVITTVDGAIIGRIGFRKNGVIEGLEVGYQIFEARNRGRGYMTEALSLFTRHLFQWKDIPRLYLLIDVENEASIALARKCGYTHEGIMRKAMFARGHYRDTSVYGILKEEVLDPGPRSG